MLIFEKIISNKRYSIIIGVLYLIIVIMVIHFAIGKRYERVHYQTPNRYIIIKDLE